jgi:CRISPR-associated protein (TIGR02710 family)
MMDPLPQGTQHVLLICSVGGTPEPLVKTLLHWRPARVIFLPSEQTRSHVDVALRAYAETAGAPLSPGQYDVRTVLDAEDLLVCVRLFRDLDAEVHSWIIRQGGDYGVVVDFTAGTKCMSAALALVARRWRCRFSYVGGERRTKGGVGVVETGAERVVYSANPWDALGYQAVEQAIGIFNHGGYAAAAALLDNAMKHVDKAEVKRELATLKAVVDAYAAWDRFDHDGARQKFDDALKNRNDLYSIFPNDGHALAKRLEAHRERVARLAAQSEQSIDWIADLVGNAYRRAAEHRFDDAVARLYRVFEALAQVRLCAEHGIADTKKVSLEQLPEALRSEWANRGRDGRTFMLALQDAYRVLKEFGDELGTAFFTCGLAVDFNNPDAQKSPLAARNNSILAHGFQAVGSRTYEELRESLMKLLRACGVNVGGADLGADDWRLPEVTQSPRN